jgi:L-cysteine desulfidase
MINIALSLSQYGKYGKNVVKILPNIEKNKFQNRILVKLVKKNRKSSKK